MTDNKLLGCLGALVGVVAAVALGWMTFELLLTLLGSGPGAFTDPIFHHDLGEWLIVGVIIAAVYVGVFRPLAMPTLMIVGRPALWAGAALNLLAWLRIPGGARGGGWMLLLAVAGAAAPWLLSFISSPPHPTEPGDRRI